MRKGIKTTLLALSAVAFLVSCTPDPEPESAASSTSTTAGTSSTAGPDDAGVDGPRVAEECPPEPEAAEVPAAWPTVYITSNDEPPVEIGLTEVIDASCFVLPSTYSAALDIPIPDLGAVTTEAGATISYTPSAPPTDIDRPDTSWWGEDRVRVCVEADDRQSCANIDIRILRPDIARLQNRFEVQTFPQLTSPMTRTGVSDEGVTPGGIARLQDAYGAEWALQLVTSTLALPQPPLALVASCDGNGRSLDDQLAAGQALLDDHSGLTDASSVALTTTMGTEPDPDLSERANAAIAAVEAWIACES